jgi:hypothetical protein
VALAGWLAGWPQAMIKQSVAGKAASIRSKLLRGSEKIVREQGAMLFALECQPSYDSSA